jgi:hypothetical protein
MSSCREESGDSEVRKKEEERRRKRRERKTHPMSLGGTPTTDDMTYFPRMGKPNFWATLLLANNTAAAPSLTCEAFPAWVYPSFNDNFRLFVGFRIGKFDFYGNDLFLEFTCFLGGTGFTVGIGGECILNISGDVVLFSYVFRGYSHGGKAVGSFGVGEDGFGYSFG